MDYTIKQKRFQIDTVLSQRSFIKSRLSLSNVDWKEDACNPGSHELPGECASRDAFHQEKRPLRLGKELSNGIWMGSPCPSRDHLPRGFQTEAHKNWTPPDHRLLPITGR